jgi:hypothetical protein
VGASPARAAVSPVAIAHRWIHNVRTSLGKSKSLDDLFVTYVPGDQRQLLEVSLTGSQLQAIRALSQQDKATIAVALREPADVLDAPSYRVVMTRGDWSAIRQTAGEQGEPAATRLIQRDVISVLADYLASGN